MWRAFGPEGDWSFRAWVVNAGQIAVFVGGINEDFVGAI